MQQPPPYDPNTPPPYNPPQAQYQAQYVPQNPQVASATPVYYAQPTGPQYVNTATPMPMAQPMTQPTAQPLPQAEFTPVMIKSEGKPQPTFYLDQEKEQIIIVDAEKGVKREGNRAVKRPMSIFFSALFWAGVAATIVVGLIYRDTYLLPLYISAGVTALMWLIHSVLFCCSSTCKYLTHVQSHPKSTEGTYAYVERLKGTPPAITFSVECYHMETRTRHYTDSQGHHRTEHYQVKVVTYRETIAFMYSGWYDFSGDVAGIELYSVTKLDLTKVLAFDDEYTRNLYCTTRDNFYERDVHMNSWENWGIAGFTDKTLALNDPSKKPCMLGCGCYTLAMFFVLDVPYRWWFDRISSRIKFTIKKSIKCN